MNQQEPTRTREQGTHVTNPGQAVDPGLARIEAIRDIIVRHQYAKIDGMMVDGFTAGAILSVYGAINAENQVKYRAFHVSRMADMAWKLLKKHGKSES